MINEKSEIIKAIEDNNIDLFKKLFKNFKQDHAKKLILPTISSKHDNVEILKEILDNQSFFSVSSAKNAIFGYSCDLNKVKTIKYIVERSDFVFDNYYHEGFADICSSGKQEIFDILYQHPKTNVNYNSNYCLHRAYSAYQISIFKILLNNEKINISCDNHFFLIKSFDSRNFEFIKLILEQELYKDLKEKIKQFDLNNLTNDKNYLLKILFSFKEYQESIKLYLSNEERKHDIEDLNKSYIANKVKVF